MDGSSPCKEYFIGGQGIVGKRCIDFELEVIIWKLLWKYDIEGIDKP